MKGKPTFKSNGWCDATGTLLWAIRQVEKMRNEADRAD